MNVSAQSSEVQGGRRRRRERQRRPGDIESALRFWRVVEDSSEATRQGSAPLGFDAVLARVERVAETAASLDILEHERRQRRSELRREAAADWLRIGLIVAACALVGFLASDIGDPAVDSVLMQFAAHAFSPYAVAPIAVATTAAAYLRRRSKADADPGVPGSQGVEEEGG